MCRLSRKAGHTALCITFVAFLWAPFVAGGLFDRGADTRGENRAPAEFPPWRFSRKPLMNFPRQFEAYFQDHFPFRKALLDLTLAFKSRWLGVSTNDHVIIGLDNWLFVTDLRVGKDADVLRPFTDGELKAWRERLQARHDELARRGIRYLFVVAPDAQTIYPEYLPPHLRSRLPERSRLDQLMEDLQTNTTVATVDLRPALKAAKSREKVYFNSDSHWNGAGAIIAYREIVGALAKWMPSLVPLSSDDLIVLRGNGPGGLAQGLPNPDSYTDTFPEWVIPRQFKASAVTEADKLPRGVTVRYVQKPSNDYRMVGRVVVVHDSFGEYLHPLLSQHFQLTDYMQTYSLDQRDVLDLAPDVVIHEIVERHLVVYKPETMRP